MHLRRLPSVLLMIGLLAVFAVFLLYPIWLTVQSGFQSSVPGEKVRFTLHHLANVFRDPALRAGLWNSFGIASCTTLLALLIALPLSVLAAKFDFTGKRTMSALVLVPMILPPFVGAIGLSHLLGRSGAINSLLIDLGIIDIGIDFLGKGGFWAIVVIQALALYPILYLNATAALANLDPALEEAAENLGATWRKRFFSIVIPLIRPGLFAGATIVFIWSFTELGTPLMFDYQVVTPVQIFNGIKEMQVSKTPYALTAVMLLSAIVFYVLGKSVFGRGAYAMYSKASIQSAPVRLTGWKGVLAALSFAGVIAIAVLPHISVVLVSFTADAQWYRSVLPTRFTVRHYSDALGHQLAVGSIRNSLLYASLAVALDLAVGLMIGYIIVRTKLWGRTILDSLAMLPLAVPGLVMAFGYVAMTLLWPFKDMVNEKGEVILPALIRWIDIVGADPNPIPLLIIAYAIRRLPYVVRSTVAGLQQTSGELEEAALNLGASRARAVRTVIVPLIAANLIAGGLLAFSFAMLEVSDSLILAQKQEDFPITKAIYELYSLLGDGRFLASALGVWAMSFLAITILGSSVILGKKLGAIFRV